MSPQLTFRDFFFGMVIIIIIQVTLFLSFSSCKEKQNALQDVILKVKTHNDTQANKTKKNDMHEVGLDTHNDTNQKQDVTPEAVEIDPIYIQLLEEAERRSALDFTTSHQSGRKGVVIGPTAGKFRHTERALRNARRIRNIWKGNEGIKLVLITSQEHLNLLKGCNEENPPIKLDVCRMWENNTLFDDVVISQEPPWTNESHHRGDQGTSHYWMTALSGYLMGPYITNLFLDSDAFPCPGFGKMFDMAMPFTHKLWQFPSKQPVDVAVGMDQYPFSDGNLKNWPAPGDLDILWDYKFFPERNTGTVLFNFERPIAHTFAHYIPLVTQHVYNNVATPKIQIVHDQVPFRLALYLFRRLRPLFNEQSIPMHVSCRTYPGEKYAGIDGFRNGMYPLQSDGTYCKDCSCTPCLINHNAGALPVTINGSLMGWEDNEFITNVGNSLYSGERRHLRH